jgi:hypothetical protein
MLKTPLNSALTRNKLERYNAVAKKALQRLSHTEKNTADAFSTLGGTPPKATPQKINRLQQKSLGLVQRMTVLAKRLSKEQHAEDVYRHERLQHILHRQENCHNAISKLYTDKRALLFNTELTLPGGVGKYTLGQYSRAVEQIWPALAKLDASIKKFEAHIQRLETKKQQYVPR